MKTKQLAQIFLLGNALLATGCATVGSKLDLQLAQEAEMKGCEETYQGKGISLDDCKLISEAIKEMTTDVTGKHGFVGYDSDGKIQLKGSYKDEDAIATAFMVAATVVGVDKVGISDVSPRELGNIKMTKSYVVPKDTGENPKKYALLIGVSKFQDFAVYLPNGNLKSGISEIESAGKDADLLADVLQRENGFGDENITVIKDDYATKANIEAAMRDLASKVTSKDTVVFYISTHGTPPNRYGKTGIIPYDMKQPKIDWTKVDSHDPGTGTGKVKRGDDEVVTNQDIIKIARARSEAIESAISFDDLQNFMTNIKTNKFIAILDTCFSGSALQALTKPVKSEYAGATNNFVSNYSAKDQKALLDNAALSCPIKNSSNYDQAQVQTTLQEMFGEHNRSESSAGGKGLGIVDDNDEPISGGDFVAKLQSVKQQASSGLTNSGSTDFANMEKFYRGSDSETPRGRVLLTATNGSQHSLFDDPKTFKKQNLNRPLFENSFFTYYLAKGLEKNHGRVFQAFDYAQLRTQLLTARDYGRHQTPQMTSTPAACANIGLSQ